jgi:hypothetical protein|tara:strand:+ start:1872 stop:2519 length:648 start_codon:yes stop_codon:yes gene_type:complete
MNSDDFETARVAAVTGFQERMKIYEQAGLEIEPISHSFIWRHKVSLVRLLTGVSIFVNRPPGDAGPTVQKWRHQSDKHREVTRFIIHHMQTAEGPLSQAELVRLCEEVASETSVKTVIREGKRLGLLKHVTGGYVFTDLCFIELFGRGLARILNPTVVEFCRLVVRFWDQREENLKLQKLESQGLYKESSFVTIQEKLFEEALNEAKIDQQKGQI